MQQEKNIILKSLSRRKMLVGGAIAGVSGSIGLNALSAIAASPAEKQNDIKILNNALYYEYQAVWAYSFAATKLTQTDVGKAVMTLALRNQDDHKKHADTLSKTVMSLGGMPAKAESNYDLSAYLKAGEGNLDNDVNIAKLALALEVDAAIAYGQEASKLKTPELILAGASIGATESAHAAAIRATFKSLGVNLEIVPAAFVSTQNRSAWVLKV